MKNKGWFVGGVVCLLAAGTGLLLAIKGTWLASEAKPPLVEQKQRELNTASVKKVPDSRQALAEALGIPENELVDVGGVYRPRRDVQSDTDGSNSRAGEATTPSVANSLPPGPRPGLAPRLRGDENAQVVGMLAEMRGEAQQEDGVVSEDSKKRVVTSRTAPDPFDREKYEADPDSYLNKIRPARVFDPAQPAADVTPLESLSDSFHNVLQGEQVVLRVKAEPGMPVAFYSPQNGAFAENLLSSVTVKADRQGVATATYKAGPGSMGLVDVMAASPVHSRQLQFRIKVDLPEQNQGN